MFALLFGVVVDLFCVSPICFVMFVVGVVGFCLGLFIVDVEFVLF